MFSIMSEIVPDTVFAMPAIPAAVYMFARSGRIVPRSPAGMIYLFSMMIGALTVAFIVHAPVSYIIAAITLLLLLVGYGAASLSATNGAKRYVETICLTLTAFLLMLPTITETLRRVPDGHPLVTDLKSPILLGAQGTLFVVLIIGLTAQIIYLRKTGRPTQPAQTW